TPPLSGVSVAVIRGHATQVVTVSLHGFTGNPVDFHQLVVVSVNKVLIEIQHVCKATGHTGTEVVAGVAQYGHQTARHVFAAMVAHTFDNCVSAGVTHRETLAGGTGSVQSATRCTVQAGIADRKSTRLNSSHVKISY